MSKNILSLYNRLVETNLEELFVFKTLVLTSYRPKYANIIESLVTRNLSGLHPEIYHVTENNLLLTNFFRIMLWKFSFVIQPRRPKNELFD